ncbi:hypothetical protein LTR66_015452 [Elasticomyces elasticus]|nr:hypothetical protein LTR66_015452 [Elasticomyces elasticus]
MLVPEAEKTEVVDELDVDWLVRQVRLGQFDISKFSAWLLKLLVRHCAPMRDEAANEMHKKLIQGHAENDIDSIVSGLESLFFLLEAMKLDVANHQIRSFKVLLIVDTIPFLKDCFEKMRTSDNLDFSDSLEWFEDLRADRDAAACRYEKFDCFVEAVVELCNQHEDLHPSTFKWDADRVRSLRADISDLVLMNVSLEVKNQLHDRSKKMTSLEEEDLRTRLSLLMIPSDGNHVADDLNAEAMGIELARASNGKNGSVNAYDMSQELCVQQDDIDDAIAAMGNAIEDERDEQIMSTLDISNEQRAYQQKRSPGWLIPAPDVEDISRRIAHIAVIHWQVWDTLVYLPQATDVEDCGA